ncbi:hypothetical protein, partial [Nonomuraea sp. KM90]|uniref:hypothetical protein n=1 Tax=Nonomuraea sp. KM90 TaxID=3457428 RepID=UPI003FCE985E
ASPPMQEPRRGSATSPLRGNCSPSRPTAGSEAGTDGHSDGHRLGVIGFIDALTEPIIGNICAAGADLASYQVIPEGPWRVERALAEDFTPLLDAYTAAAGRAAAAGAQWLVSAEGIPHEILIHLGVRELAGLPLIDPLGLAIATAEHLHRLRTLGIIARPETGYARRPPRPVVEHVERVLGAMGASR